MTRSTHLTRALAGGSLATVLLLAGCGSSDDDDTAEAASSGTASSSAAADVDDFCQAVITMDALPSPESDTPSAEESTAFGEQLAEPVQTIVDAAPDAAADAAADLAEIQQRLTDGDGSVFADPATFETLNTIEQAVADECGYTNVAVSAVDYNFEGVPATLPAGETNFLMANMSDHDQEHVMLVARPTDGQAITPVEFMADPEGSFGRLEIVGGAFAPPHTQGGITLDLEPGSYLLLCPISADETSPPHFVLGMITSLTVA
ncbi:hypothetical protein [Blastococcus sp. URHD0036]|uniref:hypothetical protein n=1 Tax=Blastococcus sp. URHD0036 TaxID=1380356 RepID=UPI000497A154|nr:hypothetical protein [Blastococcus sp. URHD0036]